MCIKTFPLSNKRFRTHPHSHSMVAGGLLETSYTTREMSGISLMMRLEMCSIKSKGKRAQRAVMKSVVSTARNAMTSAYRRASPSPLTFLLHSILLKLDSRTRTHSLKLLINLALLSQPELTRLIKAIVLYIPIGQI